MFQNNKTSPPRKTSRAGSRRGLKALATRGKTGLGLAVDTSFSRHRGQAPQQVFPPSKNSSESFECKSRTAETNGSTNAANGLRILLESREDVRPPQTRTTTTTTRAQGSDMGLPRRPDMHRNAGVSAQQDGNAPSLGVPALHKRVKGLRPSPLDLTDISPSDRVIPIGMAVPSASLSNNATSPSSRTPNTSSPQGRHEATTPTIIVTPAREDFGMSLSPDGQHQYAMYRPTSSVYSRSTSCAPRTAPFEATPPVPPLPLFAQKLRTKTVPESKTNILDRSASAESHKATLSICTVFEEEDDSARPTPSTRSPPRQLFRSLTSQSMLPTPRRSRGWWNVITSPFSARSNGFIWRSPVQDTDEKVGILGDVAAIGEADASRDPNFAERSADDEEIRSAPAAGSSFLNEKGDIPAPKRSATASGALDPNAPDFSIYRIPSQGAAAAYYDQNKHFPSLIVDPSDGTTRTALEDLSPLTDVCACEHHNHGKAISAESPAGDFEDGMESKAASQRGSADSITTIIENDRDTVLSPFGDAHAVDSPASSHEPSRSIFTSPTADELNGGTSIRPNPDRSGTQATVESHFSALTDNTPTIEDAHIATFVGPRSSNGEQRAVTIPPSRSATPPSGPGLQEATMASRSIDSPVPSYNPPPPPPPPQRPPHTRNDSYGLGISGDHESLNEASRESEKSLYPLPKPLAEQPRLGTDRFGQLKLIIPGSEKPAQPQRPWYKRFFWPLVAAGTFLLLLLIVLLIMFIPQKHGDVAVQGTWVNLTGYPALPEGVTTVVQPQAVKRDQCVKPRSLWSCAVPRAQQFSLASSNEGESGTPDFRFEIRFRNSTSPLPSGSNSSSLLPTYAKRSGPSSVQSRALQARSAWSEYIFSPSPAPPSEKDQVFLGKNADGNTAPFEGEATPFYFSLLDPAALEGLSKRDGEGGKSPYPYPNAAPPTNTSSTTPPSSSSSSSSDRDDESDDAVKPAPTSPPSRISRPPLTSSRHPSAELLYPLARAQPLRLYNRGHEDEYYGFYTYFDRVVYASDASTSSIATANTTTAVEGNGHDKKRDGQGGRTEEGGAVALKNATALCTWSQTRLHIQIWTRRGTLPSSNLNSSTHSSDSTIDPRPEAQNSSASTTEQPGSFPYPITITTDRHGGDAEQKGVSCYGLDVEQRVTEAKTWIFEDRGAGGEVIHGAEVPGSQSGGSEKEGEEKRDSGEGKGKAEDVGGVDGGSGGCGCEWTNMK